MVDKDETGRVTDTSLSPGGLTNRTLVSPKGPNLSAPTAGIPGRMGQRSL